MFVAITLLVMWAVVLAAFLKGSLAAKQIEAKGLPHDETTRLVLESENKWVGLAGWAAIFGTCIALLLSEPPHYSLPAIAAFLLLLLSAGIYANQTGTPL